MASRDAVNTNNMVEVRKINAPGDMDAAHAIRKIVFVEEQGCPPQLEWEHDESATHFLALIDGIAAGAARWRKTVNGYKLERFAVLKSFRGKGVGSALVRTVLDDLPKDGLRRYLNAQLDAVPLYLKFNFHPEGELFEEAGMMHRQMVL
jgi:predicted GNAT family N-acyltransferase